MDPVPASGDVVVVGAGPAGAAVAARLADAGRRVVLIEAGPGGPRPPSVAGLDLVASSEEQGRLWPGLTVRDRPGRASRTYRQGFGVGGGSTINGMVLTPGDRADYERWVDEWACVGWGPDDLAPWIERARGHHRCQRIEAGPVSTAVARAAADAGHPVGGSSLDPDRLGVLGAELSATSGRRWSAADAHLGGDPLAGDADPGTGGPVVRSLAGRGVTVVSQAEVVRIEPAVGPDEAPGVRPGGVGWHRVVLASGRTVRTPLVVVAAGALGTPALLLRSGLTSRPVGARLRDHPSYAFTLVLRDGAELGERLAAHPPAVSTLIRWSSEPDWPGDLQAIVIDRVDPPGHRGPPLAVVAVGLMAVTSTGAIRPSAEPGAPAGLADLDIVTGQLSTAADRRRLRQGVRTVARWLRSPAVDELVEAVHLDDGGRPLADLDRLRADELDALIAARPGPYAHPAATCPMGPADRPSAVTAHEVGRAGELLGYPGIRVADASVFPDLVRGGLQLPVDAVATRIADDIVRSAGG